MSYRVFVSCPKGLEYLLEQEVKSIGLPVNRVSPQGVEGETDELLTVYNLCLWSRLANRIHLILFSGQAHNEQTLYQLCHQFPWQTVFRPDKTFAIEFHGSSKQIRNSMYGAQVIKDSIVDYFRKTQGARPNVEKTQPQISLQAHLKHDSVTVSLDLTGYSLHQRGYRTQAGAAPLKENVAAALLIRANWPELAMQGYGLHDPFCGAGTLVIEAALMGARIAPGLIRHDQAVVHWAQHSASLWEKARSQALKQVRPFNAPLLGTDSNVSLIPLAKTNAERAGVLPLVEFKHQAIQDCRPPCSKGLVVANPPYGERLGKPLALLPLYQTLGATLHKHYQGWESGILTAEPMLAKAIGLRSHKQYTLFNGALECKLYCIHIGQGNALKNTEAVALTPKGAEMLANRLRKNDQHLQKWAKRHQISCYRVYDADLPEYAYAIDLYNNYAVLQEYAPPASIPAHKAERRSLELIQTVPAILGIAPDKLILKQRKHQKGKTQYEKLSQTQRRLIVEEGQAKFYVNLYDYLDTGLFLDLRRLRLRLGQLQPGKRFLNCFCYTGSASIHAALAGAFTTSLDLSNTYLTWAKDNFRLNRLDFSQHAFVQDDCLSWLRTCREKFDVILLAPPTFSNSKRTPESFDIHRDHPMLIEASMRLLNPGGSLYFPVHAKKFHLSPLLISKYGFEEITSQTIDEDFKRYQPPHRCFHAVKQ